MAPIQNTFSIIPNALSNQDASNTRPSRPPMTTKQAKKNYTKKNKGPKLSKAEQRKQELFEQDRIRREFEKERNQARAKAARDKRKEKEERERFEKRKKGLPLVEVHPSQDTLARFIRSKPKSSVVRAEEPQADDSHDTTDSVADSDEDNAAPLPKRQRIASPPQADHTQTRPSNSRGSNPGAESTVAAPAEAEEEVSEVHKSISQNTKLEDLQPGEEMVLPDQDIDADDDLLQNLDITPMLEEFLPNASAHVECLSPKSTPPLPKPPESDSEVPKKVLNSPERPKVGGTSSPAPLLPLCGISAQEINRRSGDMPPERGFGQIKPVPISQRQVQPPPTAQVSARAPRVFQKPKISMGPPPVPPKFKSTNSRVTDKSKTPPFISKEPRATHCNVSTPVTRYQSAGESYTESPPTSTQLFVMNSLDEFLPSPSQEAREIFEHSEPAPNKHRNSWQGPKPDPSPLQRHLATKHRSRTFGARRVSPVSGSVSKPVPNDPMAFTESTKDSVPDNCAKLPVPTYITDRKPDENHNVLDIPFLSTQDLFVSSQDLKDIDEPVSPIKSHNILTPFRKQHCEVLLGSPDHNLKQPHRKGNSVAHQSSRPFFTSSSREARFKYTIERSKTTQWEDTEARRKVREVMDDLRIQEDERLLELLVSDEDIDPISQSGEAASLQLPVAAVENKALSRQNSEQRSSQAKRRASSSSLRLTSSQRSSQRREASKARNLPLSPFDKMLEQLKKDQSKLGSFEDEDQIIPASQETDYDDGLDDVLCESALW
ncbi:hypothetical protein F5Y15DRAFT_87540 [Xylariaceae sp. FL0016]|nr:hypothetical protein F5Y15DRAFT_87540 [Xylariaceae sp. FL0016]